MNHERFRPGLRLLLAVALAASGTIAALAGASPTAPDAVDTAIVLQAGPIAVSAYAFDKNERSFREQFRQRHGRAPTEAELADWQALFRAQQTLLADAHARGYFDRPDILATVRRMEEHMLTQPEGPFYASLYLSAPIAEDRLRALHELNRRVLEVESVWFDSPTEADRALGRDFAAAASDEKLRRLRAARDNPHARFFAGRLTWPCQPFPVLASEILALAPGQWLGSTPILDGVLHLHVRAARDQPIPEFAPLRERIAEFVREFDRDCVRQQRRSDIFRQAQLEWDAATAALVIAHLADGIDETGHIVDPSLHALRDLPLARYRWENASVDVTVGDWQAWFNDQLARRVPQTAADIGDSVRGLVQSRHDLRDAARAGVASTPRFAEDRANFLRHQVLAAYQREQLAPDNPVGESDIAAYHTAHPARFERVSRVAARRLEFADEAAAAGYLTRTAETDASLAPRPLRDEAIEIALSPADAAAFSFAHRFIAYPMGFVHGPERTPAGSVVVLIRGRDLERSLIPLEEARPVIRQELERAALDARTLQRARELEPTLALANAAVTAVEPKPVFAP